MASTLDPTALTAPDAALRAVARPDRAGRGRPARPQRAERAHDWAASAITYQIGVTGVQTPAAMALHLGKGVCQDYAHMMLACCGCSGCRPATSRATCSARARRTPGSRRWWRTPTSSGVPEVIAYDPTHRRRAGLNYITVAVGRDYADVAPTSGTFVGPAAGRLTASKQAEIVEIVYDDGTVWPAGAESGAESAA